MNVLILDNDGEGLGTDLAVRAKGFDHKVKLWMPTRAGEERPYGDGLVDKVPDWEPEMDWADLVVMIGNSERVAKMAEYFGKGYPIFGTNQKSAELELDRGLGQEVLKEHGIQTLPYQVISSLDEAVDLVCRTGVGYAMKPWGGTTDKSLTAIAGDPNEALFLLQKWEQDGLFKGQLMMQKLVKGVEMGISCWFGPGGWSAVIEESFEHKKFLVDDLGENTGEMGTVIRHVNVSKLFTMLLEPLTDYLHLTGFVGDCSVNCIIDKKGVPWPLEFTMRLGWPDFCIRQEVIKGDPVEWMHDLLQGKDTLRVSSDIAVGVVMTHGDFPKCKDNPWDWAQFPIYGIDEETLPHLHFQQVMYGKAPMLVGKKKIQTPMYLTAGPYVMVVTGSGKTVAKAAERAYETAWKIKWPGNVMFRTDIGKKLEEALPLVQAHGFATGMKYS